MKNRATKRYNIVYTSDKAKLSRFRDPTGTSKIPVLSEVQHDPYHNFKRTET